MNKSQQSGRSGCRLVLAALVLLLIVAACSPVPSIYGTITAIIDEPDPVSSASTMLRDVLDIYLRP